MVTRFSHRGMNYTLAIPRLSGTYILVCGLAIITPSQAAVVSTENWSGCHITQTSDTQVGMGPVIEDGGWYFQIADMTTWYR